MDEEYIEAANQNLSFRDVMRDPDRDLLKASLDTQLYLLEKAGVAQHKLADHLFGLVLQHLVPRGDADSAKAAILYFQIEKFSAELQKHLDLIKPPNKDQNGHIDAPQ